MPAHAGYFLLGRVLSPHGLDGTLQLFLDTDRPEAYHRLTQLWLEEHQQLVGYSVIAISPNGPQHVLVTTAEVLDRPAAEALTGKEVYLPESMLPPLGEDAFYYHEIIGYTVQDAQHGLLGTLSDVLEGGKQDLLQVDYQGRELLIPLTEPFYQGIDKTAQRIDVALPEGYLQALLS